MKNNQNFGKQGEKLAVDYLISENYKVLVTNYRYKRSEIDVIAKKDEMVVFVEVKTRSSTGFGMPEEAVDSAKAKKIIEGADQYLIETDWHGDIRFDIIAIVLSGSKTEVCHFKDAIH